ncbi:MAG: CotH kinase family protein [Clostridia bacterium]|nr:CotH kinase family protein [Clostridia bacterium]
MNRLRIGTAMAALFGVMALAVRWGSPYAPAVKPVLEIEEIWAIEDAREESDAPLVTALESNGMRLGYDAQENTFYCSVGLDNGEEWPELRLSAPGAKGVQLAFADDYTYDWCADAVRDGVAYQILTYTQTEFAYAQIVFTGLPIVTLSTDGELDYADMDAQVTLASPDGALAAKAVAHLRGAGSRFSEKKSYRINFVHGPKNSGAVAEVPGIGRADDIILLAGVMDDTLMRDRLSWDVYAMIAEESEPYGPRKTQYVELLVNDRYAGCYIMMEPVDDGEELLKRGANAPSTDSVYRTAQIEYAGERPYVENPMREGSIYELYHAPAAGHEFDALELYLALEQLPRDEAHDAAFERLALEVIDLASLLRYDLLVQAGGMSDNVFNNMYVIARRENGRVTYSFAPWDMDLTWGRFKEEESGEFYHGLFSFDVAQRMIEIDAGGVTRRMLTDMWASLRGRVFREDVIRQLVDGYTRELDDSGAYARNALRWRGEACAADGDEIVSFAGEHFAALDAIFAAYAP